MKLFVLFAGEVSHPHFLCNFHKKHFRWNEGLCIRYDIRSVFLAYSSYSSFPKFSRKRIRWIRCKNWPYAWKILYFSHFNTMNTYNTIILSNHVRDFFFACITKITIYRYLRKKKFYIVLKISVFIVLTYALKFFLTVSIRRKILWFSGFFGFLCSLPS